MPQRRANDAQVERLLRAMQDRSFRQALARKVTKLPAESKLPAKGTTRRRAYDSAMRRFERYVTTGAQKRSFTAASAAARKPVIVAARRVPLPASYEPPQIVARRPELKEPGPRPPFFADIPPAELLPGDVSFEPTPYPIDLYDLRSILAYYDGDSREAAEHLASTGNYNKQQQNRMAGMLELAATGVNVFGMPDSGALSDAYRMLIAELDAGDAQDIEDFNTLLHDLPDWQIEMIIADISQGDTTFADWMDSWHDSEMDIDNDDNDYWQLWREAYARAKK